jgi:branched-subunit amino acid transport protein
MTDLVPLAVLMALVTYPSRALPLLFAHVGRLPPGALAYLRLVGPAVLAALAAVNTMVPVENLPDGTRTWTFHVGLDWLAVLACVALVAWRRNLFLGIIVAVAIMAAARALNLAPV